MRHRIVLTLLVAALVPALATIAHGEGAPAGGGPKVVASTAWTAAFARAAGATDVTVIAPADLPHPPDYDPRPSDLAALATARFVVVAPFDGFARRLREAAGGSAQVVTVQLVNRPETIRAEVSRLGSLFGTEAAAAAYLKDFDAQYERLAADTRARIGRVPAVAQVFMVPWVQFAGLELVGTYGPKPLQPAELAALAARHPGVVFKNGHSERAGAPSAGHTIATASGAKEVTVVNFPGPGQDLLDVFRENARRIVAALAGS